MHEALVALGWNDQLAVAFEPFEQDHVPARIAVEHRDAYVALSADGERWSKMSGHLRHRVDEREQLPATGDWVALTLQPGSDWSTIRAVLPRRTAFVRKEAGFRSEGQVLAANIDLVWIVAALTRELSARRVERYLTVAWGSGAQPVVVLTKADLGEQNPEMVAEVETIAVGAEIISTSTVTGQGLDALRAQLAPNRTAALLGSSGVGKSTLVNALVGDSVLETQPTRSDSIGRHTTIRREMLVVPTGGLVIDTPGLRELIAWESDDTGTEAMFGDIEALATSCRFDDCAHRAEPGCAIRAALASGELEMARWQSYGKLQREAEYLAGRTRERRDRSKAITRASRQRRKLREEGLSR